MRFILALIVSAVPLFAQCTTASPSVFDVGAGTAAGPSNQEATITASPGCPWQAKANVSWLTIKVGAGSGSGILQFSVDRNPLNTPRTGTITVGAGTTIVVNQAAAACTYSIVPISQNFPVTGGSGTVTVSATCLWGAAGSQTWITVPPGTQGTFDGKFDYTVQPSGCVESRSGTLGVGLTGISVQTLQITQDGSPSNLVLTPPALSIGPNAQDGKVSVGLGSGCSWSAFSDVSWLTITSPKQGTGPTTLSFLAAANPSSPRTGNIHIGPQLFTVTQASAAPVGPQLQAFTNAASGPQGAVSPGEIVSLFGSGLGPAVGVSLQLSSDGKSITKSLGGVQVLFDNVAAPVTYASSSQINAVVPYGVAGNPSTQIQVQYQGVTSSAMTASVQPTSPGIFTPDGSGIGAGAILNQDYSLNSRTNPAARGSVVQIFCTGAGVTNPPSVDGVLTTTPLPMLTLPVLVTIGGLHADVQYAGGAPGAVAGLTQINAVVPPGLAPGLAIVPITVQVGDFPSQNGVTVAIK